MNAPVVVEKQTPTSLDTLRHEGAHRFDSARFFYLETLARRASEASGELQRVLHNKLAAALTDYTGRVAQARQTATDDAALHAQASAASQEKARATRQLLKANDYAGLRRLRTSAEPPAAAPLVALNQHIRDVTHTDADARVEMKSVRRFREVWARIAAVDQVDQALVRGPENAGPLNSHMLVLRSLALMQKLSPDYLRRFMSHVDSLLWLDAQNQAPVEVKPARKPRPKK